jgi:methylenetetrahydrofolate dehydrogenase (NADP+)/methenyltetrahydrofolate cyclohydrolase
MTAKVLDGEAVAGRVRSEVKERVQRLRESGTVPGLGTILVGDDAPSARYVALKHEDCAQVAIESVHEHLPADISQSELHEVITRFNDDPRSSFRSRFPPASTRSVRCSRSIPRRTSTASTR